MTLNDLKESVLALGFEDRIEDEELFRLTAERALGQIFRDFPTYAEARLIIEMPKVQSTVGRVRHGREDIELPLDGLAYSFVSSGVGSCILRDGAGERRLELSSPREEHRGFIMGGEGSLTLTGDTAFTLLSVTTFSEIASSKEADIPIFHGRVVLPLSVHIPDLLFTTGRPSTPDGQTIEGVCEGEGMLTLPYETEGEIIIRYARAPRALPDSGEGNIDIRPDGEVLLPLLTAAYAWLDDDQDRSQYYMALYRSALAERKTKGPSYTEEITCANGWA